MSGEAEGGEHYAELAARAVATLSTLDQLVPPRRPMFIELAGTPKSGKSSAIDTVTHFFRRCGWRVLAPTEGASRRTPYFLREDWVALNAWSASYALQQIVEGLYNAERHHIVILDRGLFDAMVWFQILTKEGQIEQADSAVVQSFLLLDKWRSLIDLVVMFQAEPTVALARENAYKLVTKDGRVMNTTMLGSLNEAYDQVAELHSSSFRQFLYVDTSEGGAEHQREHAATIVDVALGLLEDEAENRDWPRHPS